MAFLRRTMLVSAGTLLVPGDGHRLFFPRTLQDVFAGSVPARGCCPRFPSSYLQWAQSRLVGTTEIFTWNQDFPPRAPGWFSCHSLLSTAQVPGPKHFSTLINSKAACLFSCKSCCIVRKKISQEHKFGRKTQALVKFVDEVC